MKRTLLILTLALCALCLKARTPRLSYGLEWGYTGSFLRHCDYSFICSEGYRIVEHEDQWRYFSNGSVLANVGLDLTRSVNLSVYSGLLGVWARRWMVPVELRARYCPAGLHSDGLVCHAGAALNFPTKTLKETGFRVHAGAGYRLAVYRDISVDLLLSIQYTTDHDLIKDPDTGSWVPHSSIEFNNASYLALNISAAINF